MPSVALAAIDDAAGGYQSEPYEFRTVHASTLDRLANRDVGFIKIDVEGHELEVLAGGRTLIGRQRPVVLIEVEERHNTGSVAAVAEFFDSFEYSGFFLYGERTHALEDFNLAMQEPAELEKPIDRKEMRYVNNFFFAPSPSMARDLRQQIDAQLRSRSPSKVKLRNGERKPLRNTSWLRKATRR